MGQIEKYFQVTTNGLSPEKGSILLSEPLMNDYFFGRSAVLLAEHNQEGSYGVILNKPLPGKFNKMVPDFPAFEGPLHLGGPVDSDALFYLHTCGDLIEEAVHIGNGLYWGGDPELIKELVLYGRLTPMNIRFYAGYSGWSPRQLASEIKSHSWVVTNPGNFELMKENSRNLWNDLLAPMGPPYNNWKNFPRDPSVN